MRTTLTLFSASRVNLAKKDSRLLTGGPGDVLTMSTPELRVRNRYGTGPVAAASTPGYYYASIAVIPTQTTENGRLMPVQLNLAVDGSPSGQPEYAAQSSPTSSASTSPSGSTDPTVASGPTATSSASGVPSAGIATAVVLAVVAALGGWLYWRRRRTAGPLS